MTDKFISIEGIAKRYPGADGGATAVFENLWLSMARGEFGCVIGHSGCGKTTVLNILAGLDQPSEGAVIVDGQAIEGTSLDRAVIFRYDSARRRENEAGGFTVGCLSPARAVRRGTIAMDCAWRPRSDRAGCR